MYLHVNIYIYTDSNVKGNLKNQGKLIEMLEKLLNECQKRVMNNYIY